MRFRKALTIGGILAMPLAAAAQLAPGPYEILPFEEAHLQEAWYDLLPGSSQIADWTGWTSSTWRSPNAYNNHSGSDFALDTGTPVYAAAAGVVTAIVNNVPENNHSSGGYGNYVRIDVDGAGALGENLHIITAHMLPNVQVTVGQRVVTGQLIGFSDNTGNSTSEHCHVECLTASGTYLCPFYSAAWKYPILFSPNASTQVGHVVRVTATSTALRSGLSDTAPAVSTAHRGQMYFASFWQHGYYRVFVPDDAANRSLWLKATDVQEIFAEATIIQPLPDAGTYVHNQPLASFYSIHEDPDVESAELGFIVHAGGRFAADEEQGGWYRIPVPGPSDQWGWVKPDGRMVVYPELYNPAIDIEARPPQSLPVMEDFEDPGKSYFGKSKFNRSFVKEFTPAAPNGGDGKALFITDATNTGDGTIESVAYGGPGLRNHYVQADVYFVSRPTPNDYDRYGIFIRDDGFQGMDRTFEGPGNGYAMLYDTDDGRLRCCRIDEGTLTDLLPVARYQPETAWHTMRIEAEDTTIRYFLDGELLLEAIDALHYSGPCGMGYSSHRVGYPADRGAWFDNFRAGPLVETEGWVIR